MGSPERFATRSRIVFTLAQVGEVVADRHVPAQDAVSDKACDGWYGHNLEGGCDPVHGFVVGWLWTINVTLAKVMRVDYVAAVEDAQGEAWSTAGAEQVDNGWILLLETRDELHGIWRHGWGLQHSR
jgi:hypothetical protein